MRLVAVSPDALPEYWPHIERFIVQACRKGPESETPDRLREACEDTRYQLWVVTDGNKAVGAMITGFMNEPARKVCLWLAVGADNFAILEQYRETIESVARAHGCVAARSYSRPGMRKRMPTYKPVGVIMEKAI